MITSKEGTEIQKLHSQEKLGVIRKYGKGDSNCRKFLRFSEGPDLRGNDTFCVGALLLPTAALVITNSGA